MGPKSPDPKAPATLPPEILDMILDHIPIDREGRRTLVACALVATWWTGPTQRRLFSSVSIGYANYRRWMNGVVLPGSKTHLFKYVRSFRHLSILRLGIRDPMRNLPKYSGEYLSALNDIHTLELFEIKIQQISEREFHTCFSAFRETLTHLALEFFDTSFSAFAALVDYFPNMTTLWLGSFDVKPDEGPVPSLSRPLRGRISLGCASSRCAEFFDRLAKLDPEYEELVFESGRRVETQLAESFLRLCANTVKYLRLTAKLDLRTAATIRNFPQLRELEMIPDFPLSGQKDLLTAITSTELRKIIIHTLQKYNYRVSSQKMGWWASVDEELCEVADRLHAIGHRHTLEVQLHFVQVKGDPGKNDFTQVLSGFRERGVVTIIDDACGDLVYRSSTCGR